MQLKWMFLFLSIVNFQAFADQTEVFYEKYFRLNTPLYRANSGDIINVHFRTETPVREKKIDTFLDFGLRLYYEYDKSVNYSVKEAYLTYRHDNWPVITIGRKVVDWNEFERYWMTGFLNGLQGYHLLEHEEEGLIGLFLKSGEEKETGLEVELMGSYIFIPQLNPAIKIENGNVSAKSDWVRLPPRYTMINGNSVNIFYSLKNINYSKIIFNKSLGLNLRYKLGGGNAVSAFAIYKPENRLRMNAEAYYDPNVNSSVVVEADPTVNHHAYYGMQIELYKGEKENPFRTKFLGGFSYVDPNAKFGRDFPVNIDNARKSFTSDYFNVRPEYNKDAYAYFSTTSYFINNIIKFSFNYIHILTNNQRRSDDFYSDAVKWHRTLGFNLAFKPWDFMKLSLDFKHDLAVFDNIIEGKIECYFDKKYFANLGLELIKAPTSSSYWSYYRANDLLYGSIGANF